MKNKLMIMTLLIILASSVTVFSQDTGVPDTAAIEVTVDTLTRTVVISLYGYNDGDVKALTIPITWERSSAILHLDSGVATELIDTSLGIGPFLYDVSLQQSNDSMRFYLGGTRITGVGIGSYPSGRRLWATWYMSIVSWHQQDSIVIDKTHWPSIDFLWVLNGGTGYIPIWQGGFIFKFSTDIADISDGVLPETFSLSQNYPNPFNPTTQIAFDIPVKSNVTLTVYNILGQKVATLVDREMAAGSYVADWNGKSDNGAEVVSGVYFYRIETDNYVETKKMVLIR